MARRRAPVDHANALTVVVVPHSKVQAFTLEQIGDLLERFLSEILDLQDLALRLPDQIAERTDVGILERVHRTNGQLEIIDRRLEQLGQTRAIAASHLATGAHRGGRVRAETDEVLE